MTRRREFDDDFTEVSNLDHILRDGCEMANEWSGTQAVGNPPTAPQSLVAVLEEMSRPYVVAQW